MPSRRPFTFDTFVATAGAGAALEACLGAASPAADAPHSLLLTGPTGCGKTHLLCALSAALAPAGAGTGVVYTTGHDLRARLVLALRVGAPTDDIIAPPGTRLAVVDDLHSLREHPAAQALLARSWARAVEAGVTVVGACSGAATPVTPLRDALGPTGVDWIDMKPPTGAEAMQILDTLVRAHHLVPNDAGTQSVLANWNGDVRRLLGAATQRAFAARHGQQAAPPPWMRSA